MAKKEETTRIQMTFPTALIEAIDDYCDRVHVQRTAWITTTLAQNLASIDRMYEAGAKAMADTARDIAKDVQ